MINGWRFTSNNITPKEAISVNIGAACMTATEENIEEELKRRATQALYNAQDKGVSQMFIYQNGSNNNTD